MRRGGYWPRAAKIPTPQNGSRPVGIIAGWGRFPVLVAEALVRARVPVFCIAIHGHADKHLEYLCTQVCWSGVGRLGTHVRYFRRNGVRDVTMAGKLFKSEILFSGSVILRHTPDWEALRTLGPLLFSRNGNSRDDSLLTAVADMYTRHNLKVVPATDIAPALLVEEGMLTNTRIAPNVNRDINFGWYVAKQMGAFDIGQSVTIKDCTVLAVEAIEGTDACIERTGKLCKRGGWTLVKVAKPSQDMRFDVPTIGPQTVQTVHAAGGVAIAIEAGRTIVVDKNETIALAKRYGISIISLHRDAVAKSVAA